MAVNVSGEPNHRVAACGCEQAVYVDRPATVFQEGPNAKFIATWVNLYEEPPEACVAVETEMNDARRAGKSNKTLLPPRAVLQKAKQ